MHGDQVYMLEAISLESDADREAQLQAALQSFKLLTPVGRAGRVCAPGPHASEPP